MACSVVVLSDAYEAAVSARWRWSTRPRTPLRDYCLYDKAGKRIGTVVAAAERPRGGVNVPTVLLRR